MVKAGIKAGNFEYKSIDDIPSIVPLFPLEGALLLPGGQLPLNIFEPRYVEMVNDVLDGERVIGLIQPELSAGKAEENNKENPPFSKYAKYGCLGRLTGFQEVGDGQFLIALSGICRFQPVNETAEESAYLRAEISVDPGEFDDGDNQLIDRSKLIKAFGDYLDAHQLEVDWQAVEAMDDPLLVTSLCMMSPYGPAEKQALLEAENLNHRAETLIAITEMELAKSQSGETLQ